MSDQKIGTRMLNAISDEKALRCECCDELLKCCGVDPNGPSDWPLDDITYDDYDASFEFQGCKPGWAPTKEQLSACLELGFYRCWICYTDWSELYFDGGEIHRKERSHRAPPANPAKL